MNDREKPLSGAAPGDGKPASVGVEDRPSLNAAQDALTVRLAGQFCNRNGVECGWYHGEWELLKSLGIVSTSAVHTGPLLSLLHKALDGLPQQPRILLSGSTDDSLLRIVQQGAEGRSIDVVALDLCATPLALMRTYATLQDLEFDAVRANILEYHDDRGYDLILAHAFMGNFAHRDRARLVARWAELLRPGGRVATIQRIRPPAAPAVVGFSAREAGAFVHAALASAARQGLHDAARVERAAWAFAQKFRTHAITSRTEFEGLFTAAGFETIHLEYKMQSTLPGLSGPSVPSGGEYASLIAGIGRRTP